MAARKTTRKRKRKSASRAPVRSLRERIPRLSELDQSRRDAIALGFLGLGVLLAFVFYFGWDGGRVGHALSDGLRFFLGAVAYLTPLLLFGIGAVLMMHRGEPDEAHHRKLGVALLGSALMLGFAAGTLGLGPELHGRRVLFDPDQFMDRGGLIGEAFYWAL